MLESLDWKRPDGPNDVSDCTDCSACCVEQPVPPGYLLALRGLGSGPDRQRLAAMPRELREQLAGYKQLLADGNSDVVQNTGPCLWLDLNSRCCRHHDWRPQHCRDHEAGSPSCLFWRNRYMPDSDLQIADENQSRLQRIRKTLQTGVDEPTSSD